MDVDQLQETEKWLLQQAEATKSTSKTIAQLFSLISTKEVAKNVTILSPAPIPTTPHVTIVPSVSHTLWITPGLPNDFNLD
jgi:hypothetical protein